jgi:Cu/Ag efflux protein CusF
MTRIVFLIAAAALGGAALAQSGDYGAPGGAQHGGMQHGGAQAALADGEVRKVDKEAKKMTIKHGPIPSMDMPPMTMVYRVKDAAMLDKVKAGDKVKFSAEKIGGQFTVTEIEAVK